MPGILAPAFMESVDTDGVICLKKLHVSMFRKQLSCANGNPGSGSGMRSLDANPSPAYCKMRGGWFTALQQNLHQFKH